MSIVYFVGNLLVAAGLIGVGVVVYRPAHGLGGLLLAAAGLVVVLGAVVSVVSFMPFAVDLLGFENMFLLNAAALGLADLLKTSLIALAVVLGLRRLGRNVG